MYSILLNTLVKIDVHVSIIMHMIVHLMPLQETVTKKNPDPIKKQFNLIKRKHKRTYSKRRHISSQNVHETGAVQRFGWVLILNIIEKIKTKK